MMTADDDDYDNIAMIDSGGQTEMEVGAARSELAAKFRDGDEVGEQEAGMNAAAAAENQNAATGVVKSGGEEEEGVERDELEPLPVGEGRQGTILEGAFVDPAYTWPAADGQGKNAIELQATLKLLKEDGDNGSIVTTETLAERMKSPEYPHALEEKKGWYQKLCCRNAEAVVTPEQMRVYEEQKALAKEARREHAKLKKKSLRQQERQIRKEKKYLTVPEGILIYRLDTTTKQLELVSEPHLNTNQDALLMDCVVESAIPAPDKSRRAIQVTDTNGIQYTLTACEQRTATAWLEAISLMNAKHQKPGGFFRNESSSSRWTKEKLDEGELDVIEEDYMNLANYSHKLIRAGALPGTKKGSGGAGGIYYNIEKVQEDAAADQDEEALEAIAKRRAVMKDSWDFYRMICSLLRDRHKYDEVFRKLQLDPVYPYLNSMTGLNDPGDTGEGYENLDKQVIQKDLPEYDNMTKTEVAEALVNQAEKAMPSLVEICKALAGSLGMEEVGVGPVKDAQAAIRKAEKKYGGDLLKVTDYCRALLVVKDLPSLLALLELARDSFGPLITRVKMSTLKSDRPAKPGGYRDCIINLELKGHICEIQVHLWPMWMVCGVDGFRHFRHCVEYNTDSFEDPYEALDGLDRKTMAELVVMAEEAVAETPLDNLEWYHEKFILDYFAEAGLFLRHGLDVWAEIIFRHLIRLRTENPDMGPDHHETIVIKKYLAQSLRAQNKYKEAKEISEKAKKAEIDKCDDEKKEAEKSLWASFGEAYDMIVDPNRKEREEEQKFREEVKQSKKQWRRIRHERFPFLDADAAGDEKKVDDLSG